MNFSEALEQLEAGKSIRRECWMQPFYYLILQGGRLFMVKTSNKTVKYNTTDDDMLATDWIIYEELNHI